MVSDLGGYDIGAPVTDSSAQRVSAESLRRTVSSILQASGYPGERASMVADSLVYADMRRISSHGVTRTRIYSRRARAGLVDAAAEPRVTGGHQGGRLVDGENAPGQVTAEVAVDEAIAGAAALGVCVVGAINSNHSGTLSYFLRRIANQGLVGIAATNGPPVMAYFGGRSRAVGTCPLGYGIPRPDGPPIILDMATSNAARGKIIQMAKAGEGKVPDGWAIDVEGRPTTDPEAALAGSVLPFGGPKGSGLAMGIDLLCGALLSGVTGSLIGDMYEQWDRPQRVGHIFFALDPDCWVGRDAFNLHVKHFAADVAQQSPAAGHDRVYLPGEIEEEAAADAEVNGVLLAGGVVDDLRRLTVELDLPDVMDVMDAAGGTSTSFVDDR